MGPHTLLVNKVSDGDGQFYITEDGGNITVSPVEGAAKQIHPYGESKFNGAKLLQDRKIFLSYKYENGDGTTSYATDTLTFRNRIRDGVSEWQDENPAHYE